jgi:hypothetical protein
MSPRAKGGRASNPRARVSPPSVSENATKFMICVRVCESKMTPRERNAAIHHLCGLAHNEIGMWIRYAAQRQWVPSWTTAGELAALQEFRESRMSIGPVAPVDVADRVRAVLLASANAEISGPRNARYTPQWLYSFVVGGDPSPCVAELRHCGLLTNEAENANED